MSNPKVGSIFQDRYLILEELGAGGMGVVYRAKQLDASRDVALKLLRSDKKMSQESVSRFYREFKILSQLEDPHIMVVYGLALDDMSFPFAVCEYLEGLSLREILAEKSSLDWLRAVKISIQIANGLQTMHLNGVIHRDLKPENVMLLQHPNPDFVKLIDFGLSKAIPLQNGETETLTWTGQLLGSAFYLSPEQRSMKPDARSDIYALGCVMFEMISGEILFSADSAAAAMYRHATEPAISRFEAIRSKVPASFLTVIHRCLEKEPGLRYEDCKEIESELKSIIDEPGMMLDGADFASGKAHPALLHMRIGLAFILILATLSYAFVVIGFETYKSKQRSSLSDRQSLLQTIGGKQKASSKNDPRWHQTLSYLSRRAAICEPRTVNGKPVFDTSKTQALISDIQAYHLHSKVSAEKRELGILLAQELVILAKMQQMKNEDTLALGTLEEAAKFINDSERPQTAKDYYCLRSSLTSDLHEVEKYLAEYVKVAYKLSEEPRERLFANLTAAHRLRDLGLFNEGAVYIDKAVAESKASFDDELLLIGFALEIKYGRGTAANRKLVQDELSKRLARKGILNSVQEQASILAFCVEFDIAEKLLKDALKVAKKEDLAQEQPRCLYLIAGLESVQGQRDASRRSYDALLSLYGSSDTLPGMPSKSEIVLERDSPAMVLSHLKTW